MKLNKYIYGKLLEVEYEALPWSEEDIEEWITDWYTDIFKGPPPLWLTGDRWYDRRKRIMERAKADEEK